MYISIGGDMALRDKSILGIFDLDNTSKSPILRDLLKQWENNGQVVPADDLPKAFVLTEEFGMGRIYLTQFNASTIEKRLQTASVKKEFSK